MGVSTIIIILRYHHEPSNKLITDEIDKTGDKVLLSDDNQANLTIYVGGCDGGIHTLVIMFEEKSERI